MTNETVDRVADVFPIDQNILKNNNENKPGPFEIVKEFSLNTSTHGLPGIARSRSLANRLFWCISLFIFACLMIYFIVKSIIAYFEYPTQTSITTIIEWPQPFPALTICNYSPIRYDRFIYEFLNYTNSFNLTNKTTIDDFSPEQAKYVYDFLVYKFNRNESVTNYFYSLESMLIYCDFNGLACSAKNFTWFLSSAHGLCYTFNAKRKDRVNGGILYNADNGGFGVLKIHLYTHQHQYAPHLSYGSGIVAMVHDNARIPSIEQVGLLLGPGQYHRINYVKKQSTFLPAPYTDCIEKASPRMQLMLDQYNDTDYGYSHFECFSPCMQAYIYEKCGCGNPFRWTIPLVLLPNSDQPLKVPLCEVSNPCYSSAITELMNKESIWLHYCSDCRQSCLTIDYSLKITSVAAPPDFYLSRIKTFVETSGVNLTRNWSSTWMNDIKSSYVSLEAMFESPNIDLYTQQATTTPVDVISDVGGQTGLWIGISFLSLLEVVEMLYRLIRYQCFSARRTVQQRRARSSRT